MRDSWNDPPRRRPATSDPDLREALGVVERSLSSHWHDGQDAGLLARQRMLAGHVIEDVVPVIERQVRAVIAAWAFDMAAEILESSRYSRGAVDATITLAHVIQGGDGQ